MSTRRRDRARTRSDAPPPPDQVEGRRPVLEALRAGRPITELLIARDLGPVRVLDDIRRLAAERGVPVRLVPLRVIDERARSDVPQGVIALVPPFRYDSLQAIVGVAKRRREPALLIALDGVTDPRNVGAIARSAEAAGAHGMIVLRHRASPITPTVEKTAAGALAHLPVARVANLSQAMAELGDASIWIVALDESGKESIYDAELLAEPVCIVVGDEGSGVSRLVRERADGIARIPLRGRVRSLNASVAAGIALFEAARRRESS